MNGVLIVIEIEIGEIVEGFHLVRMLVMLIVCLGIDMIPSDPRDLEECFEVFCVPYCNTDRVNI